MASTRSNNPGSLSASDISGLIIQPTLSASIFAQVSTIVQFKSKSLRVPIVSDGTAAFTAEMAEIGVSDALISELEVPAYAIKALQYYSAELSADSEAGTFELIGKSIARQIARTLDAAAFGTSTPAGPAGIQSLTDGSLAFADETTLTNLDDIQTAKAAVAANGYAPGVLVTTPAVYSQLSKLKVASGSNLPLLQPDATEGVGVRADGLTIYVSPAVAEGFAYVLDPSVVILGLREDTTLTTTADAAFSRDAYALKGTMRVGVAFPAPKAIARLEIVEPETP